MAHLYGGNVNVGAVNSMDVWILENYIFII